MKRTSLDDLKTRKEELVQVKEKMKKKRKNAEDEIENLTRSIQKEENGRDWKTLSPEVIRQNNGFRNRIWELKTKKVLLDDKIRAVSEQIKLMSRLYSSKKSKEKSLEFDRKLGLVVTSQNLKKHLSFLVNDLSRVSDEQLDDYVSNQELRDALKVIRSVVV